MLYKFKSKAASAVIMLQPHGDQLLRLIGREPASKGIVEPADMPAAMQALQQAAAQSHAAAGAEADGEREVGLAQRLWPMIEMMKRAHAADEPIVWGV